MFPVELESQLGKEYPGVWSVLNKGEDLTHRWVYWLKYAKEKGLPDDKADDIGCQVVPLSMWRQNRIVYQIDPDLARELLAQVNRVNEDTEIPGELLENLPYPCIAIDGPLLAVSRRGEENISRHTAAGKMFVFLTDGGSLGQALGGRALCICFGTAILYLPIRKTFGESLQALQENLRQTPDIWGSYGDKAIAMVSEEATLVLYAAQIVLYLQAVNADIQRKPTGSPKRKVKPSEPKPPKVYTVGTRVGAVLRRPREAQAAANSGEGSGRTRTGSAASKRPHARRGHYHHYWTGPMDGERKLIVKWLHPVMVNAAFAKGTDTVIVPVKAPKAK